MKKKKLSKKNSAGKKRITRLKKNKADSKVFRVFKWTVKFLAKQFVSMVLRILFDTPIKEFFSWVVDVAKEVIL